MLLMFVRVRVLWPSWLDHCSCCTYSQVNGIDNKIHWNNTHNNGTEEMSGVRMPFWIIKYNFECALYLVYE